MSKISNQQYLLEKQYKNASNLNARVDLHRRFSTSKVRWYEWVFDHLANAAPDSRMLELGSGPAYLWRSNLKRIPAGWNVTLSDFSAGMLEEAQQHLASSTHAFSFKVIDAQAIPFEDETFDLVIANHMLYHVPDLAKALVEVHRVLKKGGRLYAATNGESHLQEIFDLMGRVSPEHRNYRPMRVTFTLENGEAELAHFFSPVTVERFENGLKVTESEPLLAYLNSGLIEKALTEEKLEAIRELVEQEIAQQGAFNVTPATGIFVAVR